MSDDRDSPGFAAISSVLNRLYPAQQPKHYATLLPSFLGGPDPLDGVSAYKVLEPTPHWHLITFGFSELWTKESDDPEVSGFGFELTMRLACDPEDEEPPKFAWNFLQNLGRYVHGSGHGFVEGHHISLNGPIERGSDTKIWAAAFTVDPQLGPLETPHGRLRFLQIVGLTMDELEVVLAWDSLAFLHHMAADNPLLVTDLKRTSLLKSRAFAADVVAAARHDGSSCGMLNISPLRIESKGLLHRRHRMVIGAFSVDTVRRVMVGRLGHDRELVLQGQSADAVLKPATKSVAYASKQSLTLEITRQDALALADSLRGEPGEYPVPGVPDVIVQVIDVPIVDAQDYDPNSD